MDSGSGLELLLALLLLIEQYILPLRSIAKLVG